MKGVGKRKPCSSEVPAESGAGVVVVAAEANCSSEADDLMASGDNDQTQLQKGVGGCTQNPESDTEAEEEEDDGEEEEEKGDGDGVGQDSERPKLDDGFYEIEAIRRRRVRKGQLQYLIKWRGWPETANTWEPLENLQTCSDVIDAFEESMSSGKHRKRKRKNVVPHSQPKKKQNPRTSNLSNSAAALAYNPGVNYVHYVPFNHDGNVSALPQHVFFSLEGETIGVTRTLEKARPAANGNAISQSSGEREELNDYDPKLSELKVTSSINGVEVDKATTHLQDCAASEANDASNGGTKGDCKGKVQSSGCTGAKKRKSGCVERFRKDFQEIPNLAATGISEAVNEHMQTFLQEDIYTSFEDAVATATSQASQQASNSATEEEVVRPIDDEIWFDVVGGRQHGRILGMGRSEKFSQFANKKMSTGASSSASLEEVNELKKIVADQNEKIKNMEAEFAQFRAMISQMSGSTGFIPQQQQDIAPQAQDPQQHENQQDGEGDDETQPPWQFL